MEASGPAWSARGYSALFCHGGRLDDVDMVDVVYRLAKDRGGQKGTERTKVLDTMTECDLTGVESNMMS